MVSEALVSLTYPLPHPQLPLPPLWAHLFPQMTLFQPHGPPCFTQDNNLSAPVSGFLFWLFPLSGNLFPHITAWLAPSFLESCTKYPFPIRGLYKISPTPFAFSALLPFIAQYVLCSLAYLLYLEECLANSSHSVSIYWMNEWKWTITVWEFFKWYRTLWSFSFRYQNKTLCPKSIS